MQLEASKQKSQKLYSLVALSIALSMGFFATASITAQRAISYSGQNDSESTQGKITPRSVLTWWSHDATGYHPSLALLIENSTGRDLSNTSIRFQGRFLDLRNGYTQVARDEWDGQYQRNQQKFLKLRGPTPYELPIDKDQWPRIECKVMSRIGSVSDEGTQDLVVTRIERITMTDDEAMEKLRQDQGRRLSTTRQASPISPPVAPKRPPKETKKEHPAPLVATAGSLNGGSFSSGAPINERSSTIKPVTATLARASGLNKLLNQGNFAGLGDDFYQFEQAFKRPKDTDARDPNWTWARFVPDADGVELLVGSKGRTGKADVIVAVIPAFLVSQEAQVVNLAQLLYKKNKSEKLRGPQNSVRYLPTGRLQVGVLQGSNCKGAIFHPRGQTGNDNNYILQLSRLSDDLDNLLAAQCRRVPMLSVYQGFAGIQTDD
ncbi:MAG: hypothetical protein IAF58_17700 [Leptolyngbya sp.]|nr:hypothetical protein [Candidatus Melainabacteria bacterium]